MVKLNNPLMGTETMFYSISSQSSCKLLVKLNNPLMGTETFILCIHLYKFLSFNVVKLNNPLMGTETPIPWPSGKRQLF